MRITARLLSPLSNIGPIRSLHSPRVELNGALELPNSGSTSADPIHFFSAKLRSRILPSLPSTLHPGCFVRLAEPLHPARQMLPSSHLSPMNGFVTPPVPEGHLADAFSSFIAAADRLEHSHWQLHEEVAQLRAQLEERNRALASSLAENERMRIALRQILD